VAALQKLIIQKAADDLRQQKEMEAADRNRMVESRVPKLDIAGLKKGARVMLCTELKS